MLEGNRGSPWSKLPLQTGSTMKAQEVAQGFFFIKSWKIPRIETALPLWETWPTAGLLQNKLCSLMSILYLSRFSLGQLLSSFHHMPFRSVIISPWSYSFKGCMGLGLFLPSKGKCSSSDHLGGHLLNLLVFNKHLLCTERCMGFNKLWEEESNHFSG